MEDKGLCPKFKAVGCRILVTKPLPRPNSSHETWHSKKGRRSRFALQSHNLKSSWLELERGAQCDSKIYFALSACLSAGRLVNFNHIGMIQPRTMLKVADNTGAKVIQCFKVLGGTRRRYAQLGDIIVAAVKEAEPRKIVKKGDVVRAVIIRQRKAFRRSDGSYIKFSDNAAVILEGKEPKGGRIFGPVAKELKDKGFDKIASLAPEVV